MILGREMWMESFCNDFKKWKLEKYRKNKKGWNENKNQMKEEKNEKNMVTCNLMKYKFTRVKSGINRHQDPGTITRKFPQRIPKIQFHSR
jgi:hypothetical protein